MISQRQIAWFFATLLLLALPSTGLLAQNQDNAGAPSNDPPARVARIQYISGEVSLQPGGVNDWVAANLNRPLTTSDRVWTDKDSRTELNVGGGFIRVNSESSLTLTNVSDNTIQMQLDQGVLELTVRHLENGEIYEVDTPNLAFTVMKAGVYRFDVYPNEDQTWVTVRKGSGEATGRGAAVKVSDGHQVRFSGQNSLQHVAESAPALDGFDDWANVRDKRFDSSESARYVAPESSATKTLITMADGKSLPPTVRSGFRLQYPWDGLRIAMATGCGLLRGVGRGWTTLPGASRRSITAAGSPGAEAGDGPPVPLLAWAGDRSGHRPWWDGSVEQDGASTYPSASEEAVAGSRWDGASPSTRGIAGPEEASSAKTTFVTST